MSILGNTSLDVNKILPMQRPWAWEMYKKGVANNWTPQEVSMQDDVEQWKSSQITDEERNLALLNFGFFSVSESLTGSNLLLALYKYIKDPACRMYLIRQAMEEACHTEMFVYICDSLGLNPDEVYTMYKTVGEIKEKDDFVVELTKELTHENINIETHEGKLALLRNLVGFYLVMEGIFFYGGIAQMSALKNKNKLSGAGQQFEYLLRDECLSANTELLTPYGWKNVKDINYTDDIAQWNTDGTINFVKPKKLSKSFQKEIYNFQNYEGQLSQSVSSNHRIVYITAHGNIKVVEAHKATPAAGKFINAGILQNNGKISLYLEEQYLIALQADGHIPAYSYTSSVEHARHRFEFTKKRKKDRLLNILKQLGWDFTYKKNNRNNYIFYVSCPKSIGLYKNFDQWINLSNVSYNWCKEFIEEMQYWDGNKTGRENVLGYTSCVKSNVDILQAIAALSNYRTVRNFTPPKKETHSTKYGLLITKHKNTTDGQCVKINKAEYNDFVYGIEVDSGFILIKHDDAVSVTGNSLHVEFGVNVINSIKDEFPEIWSDDVQDELVNIVKEAVRLEHIYLEKTCPKAVVGIPQKMFKQYIEYIADRRLESIGLPAQYKTENPFPWLSKVMDLTKETNFFEKRPTEYSIGTLGDWD